MRFSHSREFAACFVGTVEFATLNLLQGAVDLLIERPPLVLRPAFLGIQRF
jgi:hypothetical protein